MNKRIYLNITPAVAQFAHERGALFDETERAWYVEGDVHYELEEFLSIAPRLRDYSAEYGPACPKCGAHTVKKANKYGDLFWSCSCWPQCTGSVQWEDGNLRPSTTFLHQEDHCPPADPMNNFTRNIPSISEGVQERVKCIVELAIKMHQSQSRALRWLETKKVGLHMKTPLEIMYSLDGCDMVERLLIQKFE
jgi:ssDNA-binding Zn-finger/Zn-ribbon topoisomerase 1